LAVFLAGGDGIREDLRSALTLHGLEQLCKKAPDACPRELQEVISPLLRLISQLTIEIRGHDRLIAKKAKDR
jgi:hypothetical protein